VNRPLRIALLLVAALCLRGPAARADEPTDEFKAHVQRAKIHYDLNEFEEAAEEYTQAYRIKPAPAALFNIAQAYRQAGKYDKARAFYRSYLREGNPDPKSRAVVEKAIKELDELIANEVRTKSSPPNGVQMSVAPPPAGGAAARAQDELSPAAPARHPGASPATPAGSAAAVKAPDLSAAPAPTAQLKSSPPSTGAAAVQPAPPPSAPARAVHAENVASIEAQPKTGRSHAWAYVAGGVALAALAGGTVFAVSANKSDDDLFASAHDRATVDSAISTAKTDRLLSAILFGVGGAAAVGAGLLYFLPTTGPSGGGGAAVGGHF